MTAWWSHTLLIGALLLAPAVEANNPLALGSNSKVNVTEVALEQLNINDLSADWWKPLADAKLNAAATDKLMAQLNQAWLSSPADQQDAIDEAIQSVQRQLNTLQKLQQQPSATPTEASSPTQDSYTWQDWLEALRKNQASNINVNVASEELKRKEAGQKLLTRQVDDLTASYLSQATPSLNTTLSLIEQRLTWLISQESLRLEKAQLALIKQTHEADDRQFKHIQSNLSITENDVKSLQKQALALEKSIEQNQDKLRTLQVIIPTMIGDDALSKAKQWQSKFAALDLQLDLLLAQSKLSWNRLSETYLQRHQQTNQEWSDAQRQLLIMQGDKLDTLNQQIQELKQQTERYREQLQTLIAINNTAANSRDLTTAKRIYQLLQEESSRLTSNLQTTSQQLADNTTLLALLKSQLRLDDGELKNSFNDISATVTDAWNTTLGWLNTSLFKMGETPVTTAGIIRVFVIIMIVWWFSYWLRKALSRLAGRNQKIADSTIYTLNRVLHYLIMLIGIMVALSSIGLDFSNVAWIAGALSVGIGFGLQSIVNNFVSGLIIMFERSLKVGDFLELQSGVSGTVSQINMRSTIIRTPDNLEIVVPNSEFISGRVVNWTLTDNDRRLRIPFSVEYGTDKELVVNLVMQAARNVPYTLEDENHEPQVWMTLMGDNGLQFELLVWVRQGVDIEVRRGGSRQGLRAAYTWEIESALRDAGVGMPFPQRDYYIRSILGESSVEGFAQALNALQTKPSETAKHQQQASN